MIYVKHFTRKVRYTSYSGNRYPAARAHYTGWFLLGILPLVIIRTKIVF